MMEQDYESVLLVIKEVFVYQIPPRTTARSYRAAEWDVNAHLWTGRLRLVAVGNALSIVLEDPLTGELFASSPFDPQGNSVEQVSDSSRYFVIRIVDRQSGHHAFVGLGFPERSWAFDFQVALQDFTKRVQNEQQKASAPSASSAQQPKLDLTLKEGQAIRIQLGNTTGATKKPSAQSDNSAVNLSAFMLPPPPSSSSSIQKPPSTTKPLTGSPSASSSANPSGWVQF